MRLFTVVLVVLLGVIQYPLWLGKGGWLRVWDLDRQLSVQNRTNEKLVSRNSALEGEVHDLKQATIAIEERARYELGMMRSDEIFVQVSEPIQTRRPVPPLRPAPASAHLPQAGVTTVSAAPASPVQSAR
jgi:cell division protein FtsB